MKDFNDFNDIVDSPTWDSGYSIHLDMPDTARGAFVVQFNTASYPNVDCAYFLCEAQMEAPILPHRNISDR